MEYNRKVALETVETHHSSEWQGQGAGPDELAAVPGVVPVERERLHGLPAVADDVGERRNHNRLVGHVTAFVADRDVDVRTEARQDARRRMLVPVLGSGRVVDQPLACELEQVTGKVVIHELADLPSADSQKSVLSASKEEETRFGPNRVAADIEEIFFLIFLVILASKQAQRSDLTSDLETVTSITYIFGLLTCRKVL